MTKQNPKLLFGPLAVPLLLATACGDTSSNPDSQNDVANDHIAVTKLEITSSDDPYLLHPLRVAVEAELSGDGFSTDLLIGMRSSDGTAGCVLGAMRVEHGLETGDESGVYENEAEFVVDRECYELAGRDDVELFASFDPWNRIGDRPDLESTSGAAALDIYSIVAAAAVSLEGCETCETQYTLHDNPGLDAQLREVNLGSVVTVLPVAAPGGEEPPIPNRPDFSVTTMSRVTGLDEGEGLDEGSVQLVHSIRPLGSSDAGLPLTQRKQGSEGTAADVEVPSSGDLMVVSALYIDNDTRETIVDGAWSNVDEFELVTCLATDFDQAIYAGESEPRQNDCAAVPMVIVREEVGADGLPLPNPGAASARDAEVYGDSWGANSNYGFGYSGLEFETWLDVNASDGPSTTYNGIEVHSAGSWYEAGVFAQATVFDYPISIVDIFGTFIGYDFGGGGVAMGVSLFSHDYVPEFEIQLLNGVPVSLQDIFDAAGIGFSPVFNAYSTLASINFDDGCGSVDAGIWVQGSIGIDSAHTTVTVRTTSQGVEVSGTITPFMSISAHAGTTVHYGEYIGGGIEAVLNLLVVDVPFTVGVEVIDYSPLDALRLEFNEYASTTLTTLSGNIGFEIYWDLGGWCIVDSVCRGDHSHTIATWAGFQDSIELFDLTQSLNTGGDKPSGTWCTNSNQKLLSGDFDGDAVQDYMCWNASSGKRWYDWGDDGFSGSEWTRDDGWCSGSNDEMLVGDFNGDGRDDLLCHSSGTKEIDFANVYGKHGSVDRSFSFAWCDGSLEETPTRMIRTGDYNGDGADDWYCYNYATTQHSLNFSESDANFDSGSEWTGYASPNAKIVATWDTSMCLNVEGNDSSTSGTNVNLYTCDNGAEAWDIYYPLDGKIRAHWDSDVCLDVVGTNSSTNGANVQIDDCDNVTETWYLDSGDNKIHAQWDPDMCLNIVGNNSSAGYSNANLYDCDSVTETWTLVEQ